jgi:hypothetical protein
MSACMAVCACKKSSFIVPIQEHGKIRKKNLPECKRPEVRLRIKLEDDCLLGSCAM